MQGRRQYVTMGLTFPGNTRNVYLYIITKNENIKSFCRMHRDDDSCKGIINKKFLIYGLNTNKT